MTDKSFIKPTKKNIESVLSQIGLNYKNQKVLIYYSGHGKIDTEGNFYFVPQDGDKSISSYISGMDLDRHTSDLRNLAIIIDACNSGAYKVDKPGRLLITSSQSNEQSNEEWFGGLSVFTMNLHKSLEEELKNGDRVVLQECFKIARNNTKKMGAPAFSEPKPRHD
jgi:hypothetical protein